MQVEGASEPKANTEMAKTNEPADKATNRFRFV